MKVIHTGTLDGRLGGQLGDRRIVEVDLADPGDVERVWHELARYREVRAFDPPLRKAIQRRCAQIDPGLAAPILWDLDRLHPELVLEAFFALLVPDKKTIGYYRRGGKPSTLTGLAPLSPLRLVHGGEAVA